MTFALVPVKALSASKTRLVAHLDRPRVERLSSAMMGDVLEALRGVAALREIAVVTPDSEVARAAGEEAKKVARETKADLDENAPGDKDFADALKDKARQSGARVAEAAKSEADKQDLGTVKH